MNKDLNTKLEDWLLKKIQGGNFANRRSAIPEYDDSVCLLHWQSSVASVNNNLLAAVPGNVCDAVRFYKDEFKETELGCSDYIY